MAEKHPIDRTTVVIAQDGTVSTAANIEAYLVVGLIVPLMDNTTLTFEVSNDNSTFYDLYDKGATEVAFAAGTHNKAYEAPDALGSGWRYIRIVAAAQTTAAVTITLLLTR